MELQAVTQIRQQYEKVSHDIQTFFQWVVAQEGYWQDFFLHQHMPPKGSVAPLVLESWIRCRDLRLDPLHVQRDMVSQEELGRRQQENQALIQATRPVFDAFIGQLGSDVITLDLYDRDLTFIHTFGNVSPFSSRRYAVPGFRCSESTAGVTAMSLVHRTGKAAQLVGPEHFDASLHDKICTSIPLYSGKNELTGILNIVEYFSNADPSRTLRMMQALGQGIMFNLRLLEQHRELEQISRFNHAILERIGDGIIVVDRDGTISMINQTARRLLKLEWDHQITGCRVNQIFGPNNILTRTLASGSNLNGELVLSHQGTAYRFLGSIRAVEGDGSEISGIIATFNDIPASQKMLKALAGWSASMTFHDIIGQSPALQRVVQLAKKTASLTGNVLIVGESGTGKEVFAQAIHNAGPFSGGPFVSINCAAIPNSLLESELFGYESGAYTGAKKNGQPGKFELAQNGTVFLDEVNSMPLDMQAKLLRVLQEREVVRLGGSSRILLNIKVIAASSIDLAQAVASGQFRADLFYRLNVITLRIPPLRERTEDLEPLCTHFLCRLAMSGTPALTISQDGMAMLSRYPWPGNVRELENLLERARIQAELSGATEITSQVLSVFPEFSGNQPAPAATSMAGQKVSVSQLQRQEVLDALMRNRWNISRTASELGIARNTLYSRMRRLDIQV